MRAAEEYIATVARRRILSPVPMAAGFALGVALLQGAAELPAAAPPLVGALILATLATGLGRYGSGTGRTPAIRGRAAAIAATLAAMLAAALVGLAYAAWRAELRLADELPAAWERRDITIIATVAELPRRLERGERFVVDVDAVETASARVPAKLMLSWYAIESGATEDDGERVDLPAPSPGERWRLTVRLKRPHGNVNPGGFDYEGWLLERGVRATGYVRAEPRPVRLETEVAGPLLAVERARAAIRDRLSAMLAGKPHAGVIIALAIGDQGSIDAAHWQTFAATGTTHLMSISGLHVTMLAGLAAWLVGTAWRRSPKLTLRLPARKAMAVAGVLAALGYGLLAGWGVPAQRTVFMLTVVAVALCSGRAVGARNVLALALVAVLLLDPWAVLSAGFWLSFAAVALLLQASTGRDRVAGADARSIRQRLPGLLREWGWTQWAVTIGSVPLLVWLFQQVSLVSPLANALAIPLVSFVVTPLAVLAALWPPALGGQVPALLAQAAMVPLMALLDALAAAPWAVWVQPAPPLWAVLLGLAGVAVLLLPRGFPGRPAGLALLLPAVLPAVDTPEHGEAWIDVLDVGQGLASVVRTAEHVLVFDTGPRYAPAVDAGKRVLVPVLRAAGVRRIDALFVSHQDGDHSGGAASLLDALPVGWTSTSLPDRHELVARLPAHRRCLAGDSWQWDGVRFSVLHPTAADYARTDSKTNHLSCVLRIDATKRSMLLAADIEAADEAALRARAAPLAADILQAPHHGSRTSSTAEFLAAVGAREIVIPVGYLNRFNHPSSGVVDRYAESKARVWRTDRDGALRIRLGDPLLIAAWRQSAPRYWFGR